MELNNQKEDFSKAYVSAIASVAGFTCTYQARDTDSVDIGFKCSNPPFVIVEAQLKATSRPGIVKGNEIHFPLPIKNYNDLRLTTLFPRILIIMLLPEKSEDNHFEQPIDWIRQSSEQLILLKCAYWINLREYAETDNHQTINIVIPMTDDHIFCPSVLTNITSEFEKVISPSGGNDVIS